MFGLAMATAEKRRCCRCVLRVVFSLVVPLASGASIRPMNETQSHATTHLTGVASSPDPVVHSLVPQNLVPYKPSLQFVPGQCYLWEDARGNPSFGLRARVDAVTDEALVVQLVNGWINGGDVDQGQQALLESKGDHWQLKGHVCYTRPELGRECWSNVWVPKDSGEICAMPWWPVTSCTGEHGHSVRPVPCARSAALAKSP